MHSLCTLRTDAENAMKTCWDGTNNAKSDLQAQYKSWLDRSRALTSAALYMALKGDHGDPTPHRMVCNASPIGSLITYCVLHGVLILFDTFFSATRAQGLIAVCVTGVLQGPRFFWKMKFKMYTLFRDRSLFMGGNIGGSCNFQTLK